MNREEVTAVACDYRERVLKYLRENTEDPGVERHLEECMECRALVEGYLEKEKELDIPEAGYEGTDEELKERVVHFEKRNQKNPGVYPGRLCAGLVFHRIFYGFLSRDKGDSGHSVQGQ